MTKTTLARLAQVMQQLGLTVFILSVFFSMGASAAEEAKTKVFGNPGVWQWPPTRTYHVEDYSLTLKFDEPHGKVFGDETVTLQAFDRHFRTFYFDSAELTIDSVALERAHGTPIQLGYAAQGPHLWTGSATRMANPPTPPSPPLPIGLDNQTRSAAWR